MDKVRVAIVGAAGYAGEDTAEAKVSYEGGNTCYITIHEGRFHQVKRMFFAVGRQVLELKRTAFGPLVLDEEELPVGEIKELSHFNTLKY